MSGGSDSGIPGAARAVLERASEQGLKLVTAESRTGGLLSAILTEVEGVSHAFDRGYVIYNDEAKIETLGVDCETIESWTAVSGPCAEQMAAGALERSNGDIAVSITGYADAPEDVQEAGLVYLGLCVRDHPAHYVERRFDENSRARVRLASIRVALELMEEGVQLATRAPNTTARNDEIRQAAILIL